MYSDVPEIILRKDDAAVVTVRKEDAVSSIIRLSDCVNVVVREIIVGGGAETFRLITEAGDYMITEDANYLRVE